MIAPEYFNEAAKKYHGFIVDELQKIDRLQQTDKPIIDGLAFNLSLMEDAQKTIMKEGSILEGLHGKKVHPAVDILNRSQAKVNEAYKILGLDSSMRLKIESKEEGQQSDFLTALIGGKA
ncbi:phage terminase small subunit P27 family [Peribacillus frigoritolerans]|uniref:phage terminase small subunit P27 family n=1 Tax=Peribacillus frigoritolerans TaxID=450367 RepID=UPI0020BEE981|nr:phage terminase small subunit P27 family [Peribacillus frigoritolerans]